MPKADPVARASAAIESALADSAPIGLLIPENTGGWGMAGDALAFLARLVRALEPRHIMEFGGGFSTQLLAQAAAERAQCVVTSVDHDPEFGGLAYERLKGRPELMQRIRPQIAPLVSRDCGGKMLPQYHIRATKLASRRPADLVVVDGPPVMLGGREGALYQAMGYSRPGSVILLDDASRESEMTALLRWGEIMQGAVTVRMLSGFCKGLAAVVVREPVPREQLWPRRLERAAADLRAANLGGASVVVAGENWWREAVAGAEQAIPFTERDGQYMGPPADGRSAVTELERHRAGGAAFLVIGSPFFWWLDFYPELREHVRSRCRCVLETDRVLVVELRPA